MSLNMGEKTSEDQKYKEFMMNTYSIRLASFVDWPFTEDCSCTPAKMAAAGFYHCPTDQEPDAVKCFMCQKELDGWEPNDDPMSEHKRHSPNCALINLKKDIEDKTMEEFLKLECIRQKNKLMKVAETAMKEFEHQAAKTREQLELLAKNL
ncbi:baculoviral IAP repeat-containing protein 5-like [Anneissia japonica]|uniref:baculoviral IAP repeat-containing protein 5-like n=1 Tax=Anneissia japonica TaxID=1529436 RepID=UPI001425712F|nr:baculoviral IAP repeat-containing protein 5-like [Anneissia japonica]